MPKYSFERLSPQDNSFLLWETPYVHMHVSSTIVFDAGPLRTPEGGVDFAAIRRGTEAFLHRVPRYRQKLFQIPLAQHSVWVDDARFDLDYHLRHTALPKPGSDAQLKRLSARVMSQPLDRRRPLWETWIVEGLSGGERFAMITKIHHCMIDGASGVDLFQIMMSPSPEAPPLAEPPPFMPRPTPSRRELLRDELRRTLSIPARALRDFREFREQAEDFGSEVAMRARAVVSMVGLAGGADETPLNGTVGPHRRFDWLKTPLAEVKAIRKALDCTVNDVVLTVVTGAVRAYFLHRAVDPSSLSFRVSAPVSVRSEDQKGKLGNNVSSWIIALPIDEPDPRQQLGLIHEETVRLKETRQALGVQTINKIAELTPSVLLSLGARANEGQINTIVTNVPGPQFPLYFRGARALEIYPQVPLMEGLGIGIALTSYDGTLHWGFNSDPDLVPDADVFVEKVQAAYEAVAKEAGIEREPALSVVPGSRPRALSQRRSTKA
jgi:WS/DGAT/MGAT family acyltransferase